MPLFTALQTAWTLQDVQRAVEQAGVEELYARKGTKIRTALERCAEQVAGTREAIGAFLGSITETSTVTEIDGAARCFRDAVRSLDLFIDQDGNTPHASRDDLLGSTDEAFLLRALLERPEDDNALLVYADRLDDDKRARADVIRLEHELMSHPPAKRREAIEADLAAARFRHLKQTFSRYDLPWPDDWRWDEQTKREQRKSSPDAAVHAFGQRSIPTQAEILQTVLRLPEQWASRHRLLRRCGLLDRNADGQEGIRAANAGDGAKGAWYPLPACADSGDPAVFSLLRHLHGCPRQQRTLLFRKFLQGFDQLLLVPFALPLVRGERRRPLVRRGMGGVPAAQ